MIGRFGCRIAGGLRGLGAADRRRTRGCWCGRWRELGYWRLLPWLGIAAAARTPRLALPARLALLLGSIAGIFP